MSKPTIDPARVTAAAEAARRELARKHQRAAEIRRQNTAALMRKIAEAS
jgi:hypothetical protein